VYDSNAAILAAAVEEAGGVPLTLGIGPDDEKVLSHLVRDGLASSDIVVLSRAAPRKAREISAIA
jgi:molybdopterin molybdotransferase/putative molybdopterin biosynthesis protein